MMHLLELARETEHGLILPDKAVRRGVWVSDGGEGLRPRYWVAEVRGQAAGMVCVSPEWSDWWGKEYWYVLTPR